MIERDKEYYNQKISELYSIIENQEKIIRDLQEKIILLKASEPMLELNKEYGEKDLYKQALLDIKEIIHSCIVENKHGDTYYDPTCMTVILIRNKINEALGSDNNE